jgi:hypothetical protein
MGDVHCPLSRDVVKLSIPDFLQLTPIKIKVASSIQLGVFFSVFDIKML